MISGAVSIVLFTGGMFFSIALQWQLYCAVWCVYETSTSTKCLLSAKCTKRSIGMKHVEEQWSHGGNNQLVT